MIHYLIFADGFLPTYCHADDKRAAKAYFCDLHGMRQMPRRHCVVRLP